MPKKVKQIALIADSSLAKWGLEGHRQTNRDSALRNANQRGSYSSSGNSVCLVTGFGGFSVVFSFSIGTPVPFTDVFRLFIWASVKVVIVTGVSALKRVALERTRGLSENRDKSIKVDKEYAPGRIAKYFLSTLSGVRITFTNLEIS